MQTKRELYINEYVARRPEGRLEAEILYLLRDCQIWNVQMVTDRFDEYQEKEIQAAITRLVNDNEIVLVARGLTRTRELNDQYLESLDSVIDAAFYDIIHHRAMIEQRMVSREVDRRTERELVTDVVARFLVSRPVDRQTVLDVLYSIYNQGRLHRV